MDTPIAFFVAFSFLLIHEMDAIRLQEWKLFFFISKLPEQQAYRLFTGLHIPLYILLFWGLFANRTTINHDVVLAFDLFCIIHVGLHLAFLNHPDYHFRNWFSWLLILGAGIAGAIDLTIRFWF